MVAKGFLNKLFSYYDELSYVFEKDRATEGRVETFANVGSNVPSGYEEYPHPDMNEMKFHSMSEHEFNILQEDIERPSRVRDSRTGPSGSKRRRGQPMDIVDVIKDAMDC